MRLMLLMNNILLMLMIFGIPQKTFANDDGTDDIEACVGVLDPFNVTSLLRPQFWTFTGEYFCLDKFAESPKCTFYFTFCKGLNLPSPCTNQSMCQMDIQNPSVHAEPYMLASYNEKVSPFANAPKGVDGFVAQLGSGMIINDPDTGLWRYVKVDLSFKCDENAIWVISDDGNQGEVPGKKIVIWDKYTFKYNITLYYSGACAPHNTTESTLGPTVSTINTTDSTLGPTVSTLNPTLGPTVSPLTPLSVGTILIIVLVCCVTLYCVGGCAIKAYMGKRGAEIIPNNELWSNLPTYAVNGCKFLVSCQCCQQRRSEESFSVSKPKGYDGI